MRAATGESFDYTYDAVGNRLTQTTITATTVYTYDSANRLINVGGITQTWDAKGNLLNDGVYTYTYDSANRLTSAIQGANTYTFAYIMAWAMRWAACGKWRMARRCARHIRAGREQAARLSKA